MKLSIKTLLTGTTLVVASASNVNAVPPNGMEVVPGKVITHPIFGKMKVISHKGDIEYYNSKVKGQKHNYKDVEYGLAKNFMSYVIDGHSYGENKVCEKDIQRILHQRIAMTQSGRGMLKVITANYMREYDRIKDFAKPTKKSWRLVTKKASSIRRIWNTVALRKN